MRLLRWVLKKTLLNWERPLYSPVLYEFSKRYLDLWYGDNNFDRNTNGEFRLLKILIPRSKVVFDVGANVGNYSREILKLNPAVTIHAFEPDPDSYASLSLLPVIANNIALGEKEDTKVLNQMDRSGHNSFYLVDERLSTVAVKVGTLDAYCEVNKIDHIDFLKIDVEGHEYFCLKGATNILRRQLVDYVQFEFSGATVLARVFLKDFIDLFDSWGYDLYRIRATDVQIVHYVPDRERFTLTNYLAVKRGLTVPK